MSSTISKCHHWKVGYVTFFPNWISSPEVSATWLNLSKCFPKIQIFLGMLFKLFKIYTSRLITLPQTLLGFGLQWQKRPAGRPRQKRPWILFSVVFTPSPSSHRGSVWVLPVISLLLNNTISPLRASLSIWWKRFRGTQKEGGLSIQSSLVRVVTEVAFSSYLIFAIGRKYKNTRNTSLITCNYGGCNYVDPISPGQGMSRIFKDDICSLFSW
jgi:hypothetical protein